MLDSINKEQRLYNLKSGNGYTCLGFDVCHKWSLGLAEELERLDLIAPRKGTKKAYNNYQKLINLACEKNEATGWRSESQLTPELIGYEGHRVEIVTSWGDKIRFIVGRSTGFIPCHLEIKKSNSTGGGAVYGSPFKSMKVLEQVY